jgi:hypothetical protein
MSLEEELVFKLRDEGKSSEEILSLCCEQWVRTNLPLNEKVIATSLRRYEHIQAYNSQNEREIKNKIRNLRKDLTSKAKKQVAEKIEELKEKDDSITDIITKNRWLKISLYMKMACYETDILITYLEKRELVKNSFGFIQKKEFKKIRGAIRYETD